MQALQKSTWNWNILGSWTRTTESNKVVLHKPSLQHVLNEGVVDGPTLGAPSALLIQPWKSSNGQQNKQQV